MSSANNSFSKLSTAALASVMLFASGIPIGAQSATVGNVQITGLPDDWTHHHIVFSDPGTERDAIRQGKHDQWLKIVNDPRYVIQQLKRRSAARGPAADDAARIQQAAQAAAAAGTQVLATDEFTPDQFASEESKAKKTKITKDWSVSLGNGYAAASGTFTGNPSNGQTVTIGTSVLTASVSAQATGSITIASTFCVGAGQGVTVDGVSLTTNATVGSGKLTVATNPATTQSVTIGSTTYSIQTSSPSGADQVETGSSTTRTAENLTAAINATATCYPSGSSCWGTGTVANPLVTASYSTNVVTLTGKCGGTSPVTLTGNTDITVSTAWAVGTNGTTSGANFALNSTSAVPTNATVATQIGAAISTNLSTEVTETVASNAVDLSAITGGTAGNSTITSTIGTSSITLAGMSGGSNGANTGGSFAVDFNTTDNATNLAAAINGLSAVNATSSGATVTVTAATAGTTGNSIAITPENLSNFAWNGSPTPTTLSGGGTATVQPNAYPAKYGASLSGASCSDYIIYPTGQAGGSGSANIIAYNNLYAGTGTGTCTTTNPTVYWAYNTANGYTVTTSPIISLDGTQVAFIESNGTSASLVLIKWAAETGETMGAPLNLTNQGSGSAYNSCNPTAAVPCMYTIPFLNAQDDSFSAPFCDYRGDAIYVGDDGGYLHQFTGVFLGAPAENTAANPWPVKLGANKLAPPVYDATYNAVFVGDLGGGLYCLTTNDGSKPACQSSQASLGGGWYETSLPAVSGDQIADAPLINSSADCILVFINSSTSDLVHEDTEQYFPSSGAENVTVGAGATNDYLYAGSYDNVYYDSSNNTGNLYVVGNSGVTAGATLYQVAVSSGFFTGAVTGVATGLTPSGAYPWPSPVTEFCNNGANACAVQAVSGCTVSKSNSTLSCTSGGFTSSDVGALVYGADITAGTTISGYTSPMVVTMSEHGAVATTTGTATVASGTDYVFFSLNRADVGSCTDTATHGCILSYNVSNPSSVAVAGTGLPVTTPGTNGCWATGGLSIDNSATTTGASQIYFVNLNGAAAGSSGNGQTSSSCTPSASPPTINATQASQAGPG